jgi:hypothetical protein
LTAPRHSVSTYLLGREKWLKTAISGRFSRLLPSASDSPFPFTARGPQTLPKFSGEETLVPFRRVLRVRIDCAPPASPGISLSRCTSMKCIDFPAQNERIRRRGVTSISRFEEKPYRTADISPVPFRQFPFGLSQEAAAVTAYRGLVLRQLARTRGLPNYARKPHKTSEFVGWVAVRAAVSARAKIPSGITPVND